MLACIMRRSQSDSMASTPMRGNAKRPASSEIHIDMPWRTSRSAGRWASTRSADGGKPPLRCSTWMEQLYLAGRLGPQPAPIPESIDERIMMFGLINEVAGENGLSWCKRLIMLPQRITDDSDAPVVHHRFKDHEGFVNYARYLGSKHRYDPQAVAKAPDRVADILARLNAQLQRQRQAGSSRHWTCTRPAFR
jgi:hypothetical protein